VLGLALLRQRPADEGGDVMDPRDRALLDGLLDTRRVLSLAVIVDGEPVIGLLPFARALDGPALIVQASTLARHARGLREGARFDALVHEPDTEDRDPLQLPRAMLRGRVRVLDPGSEDHNEAREAYLAKFPGALALAMLGDFALYRLEIEGGRLVSGFARATAFGRTDVEG
jgi:putative heme iron utilization protein